MPIRCRRAVWRFARLWPLLPGAMPGPRAAANSSSSARCSSRRGGSPSRPRPAEGLIGRLGRAVVVVAPADRVVVDHVTDQAPAGVQRRGVEPGVVVPAGDVGRVEEHLPGRSQSHPGARVDVAADRPQHPGEVDDGRLHHRGAGVERGLVRIASSTARMSQPLSTRSLSAARVARVGRLRGRSSTTASGRRTNGGRGCSGRGHDVAPVEVPGFAEDRLVLFVVAFGLVAEVVGAELVRRSRRANRSGPEPVRGRRPRCRRRGRHRARTAPSSRGRSSRSGCSSSFRRR